MAALASPCYSVTLSRDAYNASIPWSADAMALAAKRVRRTDRLYGFRYDFADKATALAFCDAVGVSAFDCFSYRTGGN